MAAEAIREWHRLKVMEHIERLREFQSLGLPEDLDRRVHQNRMLKMAREGGQMTSADLGKYEAQRKYATLVALAIEGTATVIDQIIDLHDRIIGKLLNVARLAGTPRDRGSFRIEKSTSENRSGRVWRTSFA